MFRPRVIPVLLLRNKGLVKSINFKTHRYLGDPINAVNLFDELGVDELCLLDIDATAQKRGIDGSFVQRIADESNIPFSVGGGISSLKQIQELIQRGAEKAVISSEAVRRPEFIREAADEFGSSTLCVCMDVKKNLWGENRIFIDNGQHSTSWKPVDFARRMEEMGAGEIIVNSISRDGCMNGYDLELLNAVSVAVTIPVVALGGAGKLEDFRDAVEIGHVSAVAGGSIFIYKGARHAFLINYPEQKELQELFS